MEYEPEPLSEFRLHKVTVDQLAQRLLLRAREMLGPMIVAGIGMDPKMREAYDALTERQKLALRFRLESNILYVAYARAEDNKLSCLKKER